MGLFSPLGSTCEALWDALAAERSGVRTLGHDPLDKLPLVRYAAEASEFTGDIENFGELEKEQKKAIRKALKVMCRETQMGVAAAQRALNHAGLSMGQYDPERTGCVFGSDYMVSLPDDFVGAIEKCRDAQGLFDFSRWPTDGMGQMNPLWLLKYLPNMPASHIGIFNDLRGPSNSITHREAAGNLALGEAYRTIMRGSADIVLTGATGTRIHVMKSVHAMQTEQIADPSLDPAQAARPFDLERTGMVLGEGAGVLIVEELQSALARGATIYGEIIGQASAQVTTRNSTARRDLAVVHVIRNTLADAGVAATDIGHIHAHGLGTTLGDRDEATGIREALGAESMRIPLTAAKSYFGNLGAGSGVIELIASLLAIKHGKLFPVLNYNTPDPDCPLRIARSWDDKPGKSVLNISVTPQGQAAAVMARAYEG